MPGEFLLPEQRWDAIAKILASMVVIAQQQEHSNLQDESETLLP